ncbi:DMT family transporter [Candidatus Gracilibacteria bacterium]|nr:DMT family transporter [Candidatus Gracilibacteria bacterium]
MFFFWALASMIGYAVQGTLLVHYARKIDPLSVSIYRTLSFSITLLPLLFFATKTEIFGILNFWPQILAASFCGAVATWMYFESLKFLPVGIQSAITGSIRTLLVLGAGIFLFQEFLSVWEWVFIALVVGSATYLSVRKNHFPHLDIRSGIGLFLCLATGIIGVGFTLFLTSVARDLSPFVAGYFWETLIGFLSLGMGLLRWMIFKKPIQKISLPTFGRIALVSWPTIIGTGGFAIAVTLGPVGIVSAIGTSSILMMTLLAHFLYQEKMTHVQWIALIVVAIGIAGLKMVGR